MFSSMLLFSVVFLKEAGGAADMKIDKSVPLVIYSRILNRFTQVKFHIILVKLRSF